MSPPLLLCQCQWSPTHPRPVPRASCLVCQQEASLSFFDRTLLHEAAKLGLTSTARALIASNVPVLEQDADGNAALHEAAANGKLDTVRAPD